MKKFFSFLLCLSLFMGMVPAASVYGAADWPSGISISADGGIVIDANSGAVLYGKNMHEPYYPASITKILTALVILENCDLDEMVTFSFEAVNTLEPNATIVGARVGDQMSVRDCLYALLLQSANEVANALAEHCSGNIAAFADLMNRKAESLGCLNSHFANPSGLNDPDHYTSAYDMALIAKAAFANPAFVEIDSTTYYDVQPGQLQQYPDGWRYYAHHRMLKKNDSQYYNGIIGGKTGYTSLAGNTLVTCAEREDLRLIAVVLNGHQTHYTDTKALLDFGFQNFRSVRISDKDSTYKEIENDLTIAGIFPGTATRLSIDDDSSITLPIGADFQDVTSSLNYELNSSAPDGAVARIDYMYGDRKIGQAYLEAITTQNYVPGSQILPPAAGTPSGSANPPDGENTSGDANTADDTTTSGNTSHSENADGAEGLGQTDGADLSDGMTPSKDASSDKANDPGSFSKVLSVLKVVVMILTVLAAIGAVVFGILIYLHKKEEKEMMLRRQRRERRLKEWGYSTSDFDLIMQSQLRSKQKPRKRSFWDRFRR